MITMAVEQFVTFEDVNEKRMELRKYAVGWAKLMCAEMQKKSPEVDIQKVRNIANNIITDNYWRIKFVKSADKVLDKLKSEYKKAKVA